MSLRSWTSVVVFIMVVVVGLAIINAKSESSNYGNVPSFTEVITNWLTAFGIVAVMFVVMYYISSIPNWPIWIKIKDKKESDKDEKGYL